MSEDNEPTVEKQYPLMKAWSSRGLFTSHKDYMLVLPVNSNLPVPDTTVRSSDMDLAKFRESQLNINENIK